MKATKHITAILAVLFIGFSTLNGQASARTQNRDKEAGQTVKKTQATQAPVRQTQATQTPVRQTQAKQTPVRQTQATQTPVRQTQTRQTPVRQTQATQTPVRQTQTRQTPVRQTQAKQTPVRQTQAYAAPAREVQSKQNQAVSRYNQTATRTNTAQNRPAGMSTTHNPKSDYNAPYTKRPMKENKFSEKHYYSGHHYHNVYPAHRIKTHYHHNSHIHHYNVLYYPTYHEIYWNHNMYLDYRRWYPNYHWNYNYGYRIQTISIFDAKYNLGEVANVYGRVYSTWYNRETDDYLLFFGGDFGAQQFTLVIPGRVARKFSRKPTRYFLGQHLTVTGLITTYDGIPEIIVKNRTQIGIY